MLGPSRERCPDQRAPDENPTIRAADSPDLLRWLWTTGAPGCNTTRVAAARSFTLAGAGPSSWAIVHAGSRRAAALDERSSRARPRGLAAGQLFALARRRRVEDGANWTGGGTRADLSTASMTEHCVELLDRVPTGGRLAPSLVPPHAVRDPPSTPCLERIAVVVVAYAELERAAVTDLVRRARTAHVRLLGKSGESAHRAPELSHPITPSCRSQYSRAGACGLKIVRARPSARKTPKSSDLGSKTKTSPLSRSFVGSPSVRARSSKRCAART